MSRTVYYRDADWQQVYARVKSRAKSKGYTELLDYLDTYCELDIFNSGYNHPDDGRYTGNVDDIKWTSYCLDCLDKDLPWPTIPFKTITQQARALGIKCRMASNDRVGHMNLREVA